MHRAFSILNAIAIMLCVVACGTENQNGNETENNRYHYQKPPTSNDGWKVSSLEEQAIALPPITAMIEKIQNKEYTGISGVLLARNGHLVLDEYFDEGDRDSLHTMRSASKAITSALVGIAIDKGHIASVDTPVFPYFPEYNGEIKNWDEQKRLITIKHLLSMNSGVKNNEDAMYPTKDWIKFYLDQPLAATPGERFSYATSGVVTLGNIITRTSGMRIPAFTNHYLFKPMGITEYRWPYTSSRGDQGLAMTGGGLNLRPRDMLKFGQLYLNEGVWNGQQLVSKSWIKESTAKQSVSDYKGEDFGYLWRMINREVKGQTIRSIEAWGNGGQFIMVFPAFNLVAVFIGENYGMFPEMEQPFELIDTYILPAIH